MLVRLALAPKAVEVVEDQVVEDEIQGDAPGKRPPHIEKQLKRRHAMGDKGKKDKEKHRKQKSKKQEQKAKRK